MTVRQIRRDTSLAHGRRPLRRRAFLQFENVIRLKGNTAFVVWWVRAMLKDEATGAKSWIQLYCSKVVNSAVFFYAVRELDKDSGKI
jgi:hypothetical protein